MERSPRDRGRLANTGLPAINKSFSFDMSQGGTGVAIGLLGFQKVAADLTAVAPGCYLFASPDLLLPVPAVNGAASIKIPVPNDQKLIGANFFNQYIMLQAKANALGMLFSNGGEGKIGG